jgi:hypothetical protein
MEKTREQSFPRWLFAIIAIGGLLASGIYLGVMSVEGFTSLRMLQALGFGVLGLIMFWGAFSRR